MKVRGVTIVAAVVVLLLFFGAHQTMAHSGYVSDFNALYNGTNGHPASASGSNAGCALCHLATGGTGGGFNSYGNAFRTSTGTTSAARFQKIEGLDSINVNGSTTNLAEITASTQPGWTTGNNNPTFDFNGGSITQTAAAPSGIGTLDPAAAPANQSPVLNSPGPQSVEMGQTLTVRLSATDADQDALTFALSSAPSGMTLTPGTTYGTATLAWTPTTTGNFSATVRVTDAGGLSAAQTITITVGPAVNHPPVLGQISNYRVRVGQTLQFTVAAADADGDQLHITATGLPPTATLDDKGNGTATFLWTPATGSGGTYPVTITVTDSAGLTASQTFTITVRERVRHGKQGPTTGK